MNNCASDKKGDYTMAEKRTVYIVGHKNPDTDSICSAISYAYLKTKAQEKSSKEAAKAEQVHRHYFRRYNPYMYHSDYLNSACYHRNIRCYRILWHRKYYL